MSMAHVFCMYPHCRTGAPSPGISDQRFLLAAKQNENDPDHPEDQPGRCRENRQHHRVPQPNGGVPLDRRLQQKQAVGVDVVPGLAERLGLDHAGGDRFGPVIDQENEGGGQNPKAEKAEDEADHGRPVKSFRIDRARVGGLNQRAATMSM
jgi:hypothetical protein